MFDGVACDCDANATRGVNNVINLVVLEDSITNRFNRAILQHSNCYWQHHIVSCTGKKKKKKEKCEDNERSTDHGAQRRHKLKVSSRKKMRNPGGVFSLLSAFED